MNYVKALIVLVVLSMVLSGFLIVDSVIQGIILP